MLMPKFHKVPVSIVYREAFGDENDVLKLLTVYVPMRAFRKFNSSRNYEVRNLSVSIYWNHRVKEIQFLSIYKSIISRSKWQATDWQTDMQWLTVILADVGEFSGPMIGINVNIMWAGNTGNISSANRSRPVMRCLQCYTQQQTLSSGCRNKAVD